MKKLIISTHNFRSDYSSHAFHLHIQEIIEKCTGKFVAYYDKEYAISSLGTSSPAKEYYEEEDVVEYIEPSKLETTDIKRYWDQLFIEGEFEPYDLSLDISRPRIKIFRSEWIPEDTYYNYEKAFQACPFISPRTINRLMFNYGYEVLITNLHIGYGMQTIYARSPYYGFMEMLPKGEFLDHPLDEIKRQWKEYQLLKMCEPNMEPLLAGRKGRFHLYLLSGGDTEGGAEIPANGIISDRDGLAWFEGTICKHVLRCKKYYFTYVTSKNSKIPKVIDCVFYRTAGVGNYRVGKAAEVEFELE